MNSYLPQNGKISLTLIRHGYYPTDKYYVKDYFELDKVYRNKGDIKILNIEAWELEAIVKDNDYNNIPKALWEYSEILESKINKRNLIEKICKDAYDKLEQNK